MVKEKRKQFNLLVSSALEQQGISLRELARKCGLDVSFLSKILNGKRNPPSRRFLSIFLTQIIRFVKLFGQIPANQCAGELLSGEGAEIRG